MKKLIMAAVAAILGITANAAVATWDVDTIYSYGTSDNATGYLVYFVDAGLYGASSAKTDLGNANFAFLDNTAQAWVADYTTDDGYVEGTTGSVYGNSATVNGYLVIFNSDTTATATYAYVSDVASGATTAMGGAAVLSFDDTQLAGMQTAGNWTAVPEPTSGLLLLLGMAGLALKRKRA